MGCAVASSLSNSLGMLIKRKGIKKSPARSVRYKGRTYANQCRNLTQCPVLFSSRFSLCVLFLASLNKSAKFLQSKSEQLKGFPPPQWLSFCDILSDPWPALAEKPCLTLLVFLSDAWHNTDQQCVFVWIRWPPEDRADSPSRPATHTFLTTKQKGRKYSPSLSEYTYFSE